MRYFFIYAHPSSLLLFIIIFNHFKKKTSYRFQKFTQIIVYYFEIYYFSLLATMLISYINSGYFFLNKSTEDFDTLLGRFLTGFAIYQITTIVIRKLNSSAEIDSYNSTINLINRLVVEIEHGTKNTYVRTLSDFEAAISSNKAMLNKVCYDILTAIKSLEYNNKNTLKQLLLYKIEIENQADIQSFHWIDSFLLNFLK